ncbi:LA_3751/LA_3752 family putative glycosyltransferase [Leptospira stimsonii]|uniref:Glycosyltransferase RgtA/B/C/D-like domain-containing protein n=1 Tax=Leptospira stimsonii TaxID=2202203 RepID=A0ABY2MUG5_9LEPT|nr:hypothetical protein [Leptospira stimsonii]TGK15448.1 hypothetical protein EHO98_14725 [Leptospira stimsonii]TGM08312.1 hypothetical protein EHQ90_22690 [Leptospira stimsonii]
MLVKNFRKQWAIILILIAISSFHFWIGTGDFYIADSLLKAMQTESLIQNEYRSEKLQYPSQAIDPRHENFFLFQPFVGNIEGKFIGAFPLAFSFITSLFRKVGFDWNSIPFLLSLSLLFSYYLLSRKKIINQRTVFLGYGGTILSALSLDFNEYSIYFLLNAIGFIWWMNFRETRNTKWIYYSLFIISASFWFRIESSPFMICLLIAEFITSKSKLREIWNNLNFFLIILSLFPAIFFLIWNYFDYGHIFGARFLFNFSGNGSSAMAQIQRFFSMTFINYVDGIPKFGLFFCSSFLLLPFFYYFIYKNERKERETFLILLSVSYIILIGISAPNDGITITGRYLMLTLLPLLTLWDGWNPSHSIIWRRISIVLIIFSFLVSGATLTVIREAAKQERNFRKFYLRNEAPLWVFTDPILCGQAGLEHLSRKILCLNQGTNLNSFLENVGNDPTISSLVIFEMSEGNAKSFGKYASEFFPTEKTHLKENLKARFKKIEDIPNYKGIITTRFIR